MLLCREFEGTETVICLTRTQNCRRPLGLVGGIGEMLRFKANGCTLIIFDIVLASYGSVKEVTGVYLNAGLICIHMKQDTGRGTVERCCFYRSVSGSVEHPVVVKAFAVFDLFVIGALDISTNDFGIAEIHRSVFYRKNLTDRKSVV